MHLVGGKVMRPFALLSGSPAPKRRAVILIAALTVLLAVVVLAVSCGGGATGTTAGAVTTAGTPGTGGGGAEVIMKSFAFDPATVTIKAGESVTWTNQDSANHTVVADNGEFTSGDLAKGATFGFKFDTAGTYAYHCGVHPSMTGTVIVQ
jgi:plastocyanin